MSHPARGENPAAPASKTLSVEQLSDLLQRLEDQKAKLAAQNRTLADQLQEWGGGVNWYVLGTRDWRMTFEVLDIHHSPAQNLLTGYRAGASGVLFQVQGFVDF